MEYQETINQFNEFKNNTKLENYSFIPSLHRGYNVYDNNDKRELINKFRLGKNSIFLVGLTNNVINSKALNIASLIGVPMIGKWSINGKSYNDVSVLINNMPRSNVLKLAKSYNQKAIIEINNYQVKEILV